MVGGVLVVAIFLDPGPTRTARILCSRPLGYLGRASLATFIWHLPVFALVGRHTTGWQWPTRTLIAVALLSLVVWSSHRWVEEPTRRWLASHLRARPVAPPGIAQPAVPATPAVAP